MNNIRYFKYHSDYVSEESGLTNPNVSYCANQADVHYKVKNCKDEYFTFEALESGTFSFSLNSIQYSLDSGETWATLTTGNSTPTIASGETIMWKASGLTPTSTDGIGRFSSTGNFKVKGNVMSLVNGDDFEGKEEMSANQFRCLLSGCTGLTDATDLVLPATELVDSCYRIMFAFCASLTGAPKLPATVLAPNCYRSMFQGTGIVYPPELPATTMANFCYVNLFRDCPNLKTAPELPATTLAEACYASMFDTCPSLIIAPKLPATTLAIDCYNKMFNACTSLIIAPELPATTLPASSNGCYNRMFMGCTSLVIAPKLSATMLVDSCYWQIFQGCTNLKIIVCLATDISASNCLTNWTKGVSATGTFIKAASMTSWTTGINGIPQGWTVETASS